MEHNHFMEFVDKECYMASLTIIILPTQDASIIPKDMLWRVDKVVMLKKAYYIYPMFIVEENKVSS